MKIKFTNILLVLLTFLGCSSCLYEKVGVCPGEEPQPLPDPENPDYVYLNLSVGVASPLDEQDSRAGEEEPDDDNYFEPAATKYERMQTLRVIIVRGDRIADVPYVNDSTGYIEHNKLFRFNDEGVIVFDKMRFRVRAGEKKKIYLIANEEFVKDNRNIDFDALIPDTEYPSDDIEKITLDTSAPGQSLINNDSGTKFYYIPMSESYGINIEMPEVPQDYEISKSFFVTRAAVKFSFEIKTEDIPDVPGEPSTDTGLRIKAIRISSVAGKEYLLPKETFYYPDKDENSTFDLKGRFIYSYLQPEGAGAGDCVFTSDLENIPLTPCDQNDGFYSYAPALYFPESREGKYSISLTIGSSGTDEDDSVLEKDLPNLPRLPRNTHVLVKITLHPGNIVATVKIVPYISVVLNPTFGFWEINPGHQEPEPEPNE